jgi:hypothetical protein
MKDPVELYLPGLTVYIEDNSIGDHVWVKIIDRASGFSISGRTDEPETVLARGIRRLVRKKSLRGYKFEEADALDEVGELEDVDLEPEREGARW